MTPIQLQKFSRQEIAKQKARNKAEMKANIIARLGDGLSLNEICARSGFPDYSKVIKWAERDEQFDIALKRARVAGGYIAADKAAKLVDNIINAPDMDNRSINPVLTHLRWIAERQARSTYGQHLEVKHSGTVSVRTSFLIPRSKQSVDEGEVIDLDATLQPAQLGDKAVSESDDEGDDWLG